MQEEKNMFEGNMENQSLDEKQVENFKILEHEHHKYICEVCNYIYNEEEGEEKVGLAPGTLWDDIPDDWRCPECSAIKSSFKFLE